MKPKAYPFFRPAALASIGLLFSSHSAHAQLYWDSNDTTAGAGTTPSGTWGTDGFWTTDTSGSSATGAYVSSSDVVFAAGTDAINAYTVTLNGNQSAVTLNVEEGSPTLSAASATTLSFSGKGSATPWDPATMNIATGASLSIGNNLAVSLTGTVDHYLAGTGNITIGGTNASLSTSSTVGLLVINGPTVTVNAGGSINHTSAGGTLLVGAGGATSKLVVSGGEINITGSGGLKLANNTGSSSSVEINSGTVTAAKISKGNGTGTIYFDGGTLKASAASTSYWAGSTVNGTIRDGGAVIDTNNFDITISQIFQEDGTSTGGGLTKTGLKTLTTDVNHTFTGKVTINGGTLSTNKIANAGTASGLGTGGSVSTIDIGGGGTLRYSGGNVSTNRVINLLTGGGVVNNSGSGLLTLTGGITGNGGISLRGAKNITVSGAISIGQANPIIKTDNGTVTLSNATNDFGYVWVAAGTLSIDTIANNGTASALGKGSTDNVASIQLGQSSSNTAGVLSFTGASGGSSNRTIRLNNAASGTTGGVGVIENTVTGQTLTLSAGVTAQNAGTASLTLQGAGNGEISGEISEATGTLSLTKSGTGSWTLSNSNTYTGTTKVNAGTLLIGTSASLANTTVTVGGAGTGNTPTLGGGGTIGGGTTIAAADGGAVGTHAPGIAGVSNGVGTQTFSSTLDYGSGSIFEWNLQAIDTADIGVKADAGTGTYDKVVANGTAGSVTGSGAVFKIVLGGNAFTDAFWNSNKSWTDIFSGTGTPANLASIFTAFSGTNVNTDGTVTGNSGYFTFNSSSTLTWTAVPEPTSALASLLITAGLLRRRRN